MRLPQPCDTVLTLLLQAPLASFLYEIPKEAQSGARSNGASVVRYPPDSMSSRFRALLHCWRACRALTILKKHAKMPVDLVRVFKVVSNVFEPTRVQRFGQTLSLSSVLDTRSSDCSMVWGFTRCGQQLPATAQRRHRAEGKIARLAKAQAIRLSVLGS